MITKLDGSTFLPPPGKGVLSHISYIEMGSGKRYGSRAVLVRNEVYLLTILVWNGVWFVHSDHQAGISSRRNYSVT